MLKTIWTNLKTTIFGAVAGVPQIVQGVESKNYALLITGIATLLLGLVAKDSTAK